VTALVDAGLVLLAFVLGVIVGTRSTAARYRRHLRRPPVTLWRDDERP